MGKSATIFNKADLSQELEQKGYVIVPFLTDVEVHTLTDFFYQHHPTLPDGMYASSHAPDFAFRQKMNEEIKRVCQRAIDVTLAEITPLGATFMVKSKGENGSLHPHQDWSIVDEEYNSYNIWLPLVDVNEKNGTLLILPESHTWLKNIRGLNIPSSYEQVSQEVWNYLLPLNMKAGEALVYDHRLLHASGINQTDTPRLVIVYGIIPEAATMRYFYGKNETIQEYACTPEFYFNETITQGPAGLSIIKESENNNPVVTSAALKQKYAATHSLWQRLAALFGG